MLELETVTYLVTKHMLTVKETATFLNISVSTVYKLIENGALKCKRISSRKIMIPAREFNRYFDELK